MVQKRIFPYFEVCTHLKKVRYRKMKTDTAIIRLAQITSRAKADGTYPIVLRVQFNGRKEKYLNVSCPIKYWDKKNEVVKNGYANAAALNLILKEAKDKVIERKYQYELKGIQYTAAMLLEDSLNIKPNLCGNSIVLYDLVQRLIEERHLVPNTIKNYNLMMDKVEQYSRKSPKLIILTELDEKFVRGLCKWLKLNVITTTKAEGTINVVCSKIASIWNYAISHNLISADLYCFKKWKYNVEYRSTEIKKALNRDAIKALEAKFSQLIIVDPFDLAMAYKAEAYSKLIVRYTKEFAIAIYLIGYRLQGLAFCDLADIKANDVSIEKHNDTEYYVIQNIRRNKTNVPVPVVLKKDMIGMALMDCFIRTANLRDGYLFPILQNNLHSYTYDTPQKKANALQTSERLVNDNLKKIAAEINKEIGKEIISPDITFYSMRHTFATIYMANPNANPVHLATMMGRSVSGIYRYVKSLQSVDDIIDEREKVFEQYD